MTVESEPANRVTDANFQCLVYQTLVNWSYAGASRYYATALNKNVAPRSRWRNERHSEALPYKLSHAKILHKDIFIY